jgi:3-oxoacyl-[acyl-carrier-protein] synthase-3
VIHSDPSGWDKVVIPSGGHFIQEGPAVQGFAIRKTVSTLQELGAHLARGRDRMWFIGHQANLMMLQTACRRAEIDPSRHLYNVDEFGNCGAAGAPSVLSQHWERLPAESEVAMVVVGSGLTWGGLLIDVGRPA